MDFRPFKLIWNRISFSRLTFAYFLFSLVHFIIQLSLQIKPFTINADAAHFLSQIVDQAQTTNDSLPFLSGNTLRMCSWVPSNLNVQVASCPVIWNGTAVQDSDVVSNDVSYSSNPVYSASPVISSLATFSIFSSTWSPSTTSFSSLPSTSIPAVTASPFDSLGSATTQVPQTVTVFVVPQSTPNVANSGDSFSNGNQANSNLNPNNLFDLRNFRRDVRIIPSRSGQSVSVSLEGLDGKETLVLDNNCLWSLNWPLSILKNTKREDIVFIAFQLWVFGMSAVALLNESIPHILASLLTHMMATGWAAFQIVHTAHFRSDFNSVVTNGACNGISLLPPYWNARRNAEIPSLVLNVISLIVSSVLTWKLIKLFGWQTFKRVGASLTINRIYRLVLFLSITIQLSLFFMVVTVSLWVDQLMNNIIGDLGDFQKLFKVTSFITLALLVPWLMTGWFAVRRELRFPMLVFLFLSVLYLGGWGFMFFSTTFRWTFSTWTFFSIMATASVLLTLLSTILGIVCHLNFGKGLARYLKAHEPLDEEDCCSYYSNSDAEKVAFPSSEKPLPVFDPHPTDVLHGSILGPRFSNNSSEPFEISIAAPSAVHRSDSYGSTQSFGSEGSQSSHARSNSDNSHSNHKRWVIE
jgi:hypothetical protein